MGKTTREVFGVHGVATYNKTTGALYGGTRLLGNSTFNMTGDQVELYAGSIKAPVAIEDANINTEINLSFKEVADWMIQLFLAGQVTLVTTPSTGEVTSFENVKGSIKSATVGIASVSVKSGAESKLKRGKYVVIAASPTTVNVYALSDIEFNRGEVKDYIDDTLKITSSALTITASTAVEVPGFGIELTGGSGTIGMTAGDSAEFQVFSPYSRKMTASIGGSSDVLPEFGCLMVAQKRSDGQMFDIDAYRCKGSGLPIGLAEKKFAEPEVKAKAFWDPAKNAIALLTATVA
jgi:hypothetical protein